MMAVGNTIVLGGYMRDCRPSEESGQKRVKKEGFRSL
jgi:hypothetical protein